MNSLLDFVSLSVYQVEEPIFMLFLYSELLWIRISIVIPLLNKRPHVRRSLGSVLNQTAQDYKVIVVDGGSEDSGPAIVEKFASLDPRIRLVQQEGKGVSEARNQGIRESKSKLIVFLDADDEWMPDYLETVLKLRENIHVQGCMQPR